MFWGGGWGEGHLFIFSAFRVGTYLNVGAYSNKYGKFFSFESVIFQSDLHVFPLSLNVHFKE